MRLSYEIKHRGVIEKRELPFVIGVLGDFTGTPEEPLPRLRERSFVDVTNKSMGSILQSLTPRVSLDVPNYLKPSQDHLSIRFDCRNGFDPEAIAEGVQPIRDQLILRQDFNNLLACLTWDSRLEAIVNRCLNDFGFRDLVRSQLDQIGQDSSDVPIAISEMLSDCGWKDDPWTTWVRGPIVSSLISLLSYSTTGLLPHSRDATSILRFAIRQFDEAICAQLHSILRDPSYQQLERTWRGLSYLVAHSLDLPRVKIKLLNVSKKELLRDLQRASEVCDSALYKKIYGEFDTLGGQPFSLLLGAYDFSHDGRDVELLEKISLVASDSHCPFLASAAPEMLHLDSFEQLEVPRSLAPIFESSEYARWNSFRASPDPWNVSDSRFVGLVMPRVLLRRPHQFFASNRPSVPSFTFREEIRMHGDLLWGSAAFVLAVNLARRFAASDFNYSDHGGLVGRVADLPISDLSDDEETEIRKSCPVEVAITDEREVELRNLGFIALCRRKGESAAVFFDVPSCHSIPPFTRASDRRELCQDGRLHAVIVASCFAHYIKCILRDNFGAFSRLSEWEHFLDSWINKYVGDESQNPGLPLTMARIKVEPRKQTQEVRVIVTLIPRLENCLQYTTFRIAVSLPQMRGCPHDL